MKVRLSSVEIEFPVPEDACKLDRADGVDGLEDIITLERDGGNLDLVNVRNDQYQILFSIHKKDITKFAKTLRDILRGVCEKDGK